MIDLKKFFLDLVFPIQCLGCGKEGEWLCSNCKKKDIKVNYSGQTRSLRQQNHLDKVWVCADYRQSLLSRILHAYKYNFVLDLSIPLSNILVQVLRRQLESKKYLDFDLVATVPLSKKRILWRGFNQSEVLGKIVSQEFSWEFAPDAIFRKRNTRPQVGLGLEQRLTNVRGIFAVKDEKAVKNKRILLIDDVVTTGATMNECAKTLKSAGAVSVHALVVARD